MERITLEEYLGPYIGTEWATPEIRENATKLLEAVNSGLGFAVAEGIALLPNPKTDSYISGEGHGGFRGPDFDGGAIHSKHRTGQAVDIYDPYRVLAVWSLKNRDLLRDAGIACMEAPRFTPTWVHWQCVPVGSGSWAFVPSRNAHALAAPLEGEIT